MSISMRGGAATSVAVFALILTTRLPAQRQPTPPPVGTSVTVHVRVTDSAGTRVGDADVAILRGLGNVVGHAVTDASGLATMTIMRQSGDYNLAVRKIGYDRSDRFFRANSEAAVSIEMALTRSVTTLPTVSVTAAEDLKRKSYHLDADAIEHSDRPILDGTDLFKLRPDMLNARGGTSACSVPYTDHDGWIESVWVNGRRVQLVTVDPLALARRVALGLAPIGASSTTNRGAKATRARNTMPGELPPHAQPKLDTVLTILKSIHPEHIAEVTYHDCFDSSIGKNGSEMAMFIALKPGIGFEPGVGSFVADDARPLSVVAASAASSTPPDSSGTKGEPLAISDLPRHRFRVLGVYEATTGDVIEGAAVIDTTSGLRAFTSNTGTVSLLFLPDGGSTVRIHKLGLRDTTFFARIAPTDTLPIMLLLTKAP